RAEADGRTVHEHKGARRRDATEFADLSMHAVDQPDAVRRAVPPLLDHARAVVEQWAVDERGPAVQHLDHLARKIAESPTLIRIDRQLVIVAFERVVEIDDAADEAGRENADAAEIEQVDGAVRRDGVIPEMRVAVDHAVAV